ncbi:MAG TPA: undecaprenyl/decaprenyl-phosphate alpha-N-acetylglucosaminyl 1-phosphate transferase [Alphaproteobacteria bacterium]
MAYPARAMASATTLEHLLAALLLAALSALLTWAMIRVPILDRPNARSSHARPVPRTGGIAIVATFLAGLAALAAWSGEPRPDAALLGGFAASLLVVAAFGFADDLGRLGFKAKLAGQLAAAAIFLAAGGVIREVHLPGAGTVALGAWGYAATALWLVAIANMVNFMDGLDGLAGGTGVVAAAAFALGAGLSGATFAAGLALALAAGCAGFTLFNAPPARVFMGDAGSQFLGFALAALAVIASGHETGHNMAVVMALLLFHFIFDTVWTFLRRLAAGERVTEAHRTHLYQLLNRLGRSHRAVSLFYAALCLAQGAAAILLVALPGLGLLVFVPFLAFELCYAVWLTRAARRAGLLPGPRTAAAPPH